MLYKFKSKSAGDVIMTGPNGDQIMHILGREPAPQGIVQAADLPSAMAALQAAIAADDEAREQAEREAQAEGRKLVPRDGVGLRQRAWPLIEMMKRAHAHNHDIVWGV